MKSYLAQTSTVQTLIENVVKSLNFIQDNQTKNEVMNALKPFYNAITPTTIDVEEIKSIAAESKVFLTHNEALEILESICLDLDLNYVDECIKYHVNELIYERNSSSNK